MQWYYVLNGARLGPITQEQFDQLVQSGAITPETLIWRAGMTTWLPLSQVLAQPALASAPDADSAICAVSGRVCPKRDMLEYNGQWISAEHKDEFFQRLREGVPQQGEMRYAGFWIRFLAKIIDGFCMGALMIIPVIIFMFVFTSAFTPSIDPATHRVMRESAPNIAAILLLELAFIAVLLVITLAYEIFFIRKYDATPGKMAIGLKVVRANGDKLSIGRIIGRHFAEMLSQHTFYIGYMLAGWTSQKCALHDLMCDTRVIKK